MKEYKIKILEDFPCDFKEIEKAENKGLQGDELNKYIYRKNGTLPLVLVAIIGIFEFLTIYN